LGGISLFFKQRIPFSAVLLVFLLLLVGYSLCFGTGSGRVSGPEQGSQNFSVPITAGIEDVKVKIELGGARLNIRGDEQEELDGQLLQGRYSWENGGLFGTQPRVETRGRGEEVQITVDSVDSAMNFNGRESELELSMSDQARYSLEIDAGAIDGNLDFRELRVDELKLDTGASRVRLEFGDNGGTTKADISCGASDITLVVPESVGVKVNFSGVISSTNFMGSAGVLGDKEWVSPNYAEAKSKIDLDISAAAGSVKLERPPSTY